MQFTDGTVKLALPPTRLATRVHSTVEIANYPVGRGLACPAPAEGGVASPRFQMPTHRELPVISPGSIVHPIGVTEPEFDPTSDPSR